MAVSACDCQEMDVLHQESSLKFFTQAHVHSRFGESHSFEEQSEAYIGLFQGFAQEEESTFIESSSPSSSDENYISFPGPGSSYCALPPALMDSSSEDDSSCGGMEDFLQFSSRTLAGDLDAMWNSVHQVSDDIIPVSRASEVFSSSSLPTDTALSADICKSLMSFSSTIEPCILTAAFEATNVTKSLPAPNADPNANPVERRVHNAMERERRGNLRRCFERLRNVLPQLRDNRAHSLQILHEAVTYIAALQAESSALEAAKLQLALQNSSLNARISTLRDQVHNRPISPSPALSEHFSLSFPEI